MPSAKTIALVTGANKGIGKEISRKLARNGVFVLLGARNRERGERAEAELRAEGLDVEFIPLDVTQQQSVDTAAAQIERQFGRLDILVNNAGVALDWVAATETTIEILQETFDTNVFGVFRVTQGMIPLLKKSKTGRIVNISSALGSLTILSDPTGQFNTGSTLMAYCMSKSALNAMTVKFAIELKSSGIKVNAANPGYTATDMNQNIGVKTVEQGAATPVRLALLADDGPTGGMFNDDGPVPW